MMQNMFPIHFILFFNKIFVRMHHFNFFEIFNFFKHCLSPQDQVYIEILKILVECIKNLFSFFR
jgi:hypothetical protein